MINSKLVAKTVTRLFLVLILVGLALLMSDNSKLDHIYLAKNQMWSYIPPILLIIGFVTLLIICARKKYSEPDMNWLLVVNTVVLMAYGITLFIRIYSMLNQAPIQIH